MGTKVTSSSGSVLEEPEIQKLQMQAKIFKENSLNKLNALKSTTQLLERQTFSGCILYQQAFAQLFGDSVRTFKFQLSQHMNNLETLLNAETLHEMDSKSALSVIKVQFERFINSDLLKPLDIYSRSFSSDREVRENFRDYTKMTAQTFKETIIQNMNSIEQCIIERASHEQELKMMLKKLSERQLQIQQCKVQEVQSSVTSSGDETSSGIVSDEEIEKKELEAHYGFMAKIQEVLPAESSSIDTPLEQVNSDHSYDSTQMCDIIMVGLPFANPSRSWPRLQWADDVYQQQFRLAPQSTRGFLLKNVSSGLVPQGQKASDYDNSDPVPPRQNVVPSAEKPDSSHQGTIVIYPESLFICLKPFAKPRGLVPQGQKASDYDNSDPVPPRQNVVPSAEKPDSSNPRGLEFLFSPLLEEYTSNTRSSFRKTTMIKATNAIISNKMSDGLARDPDMSWIAKHMPGVEQRPQFWSRHCELGRGIDFEESFAPVARLEAVRIFVAQQHTSLLKVQCDPTLFKLKYGEDILLVQRFTLMTEFLGHNPKNIQKDLKVNDSRFEISLMGEMKFFLGLQNPPVPKDIVQAVCYCARYQARPTQKHLKEVKRIFKYLKGTINMGIWYPKDSGFELTAFSDADHAGCIDTRKSTSGGIQFLGDKLVSWMSKKQNCTAMSSAEAEYVALSASCAQVENGIIELYFVRTEYQLADMFTKALPEDRFKYLVRRIGMRCLTPAELEDSKYGIA
ncbi:hypothetical protein Tco_0092628 [Tanacetum coccineum]